MDDEYIAKNRSLATLCAGPSSIAVAFLVTQGEKKTITGASQGFAAAGKTLMDGEPASV